MTSIRIDHFRTANPVWILRWLWNNAQSFTNSQSGIIGDAYCFLGSSVEFLGHMGRKIDFGLIWNYKVGRRHQIPPICPVHLSCSFSDKYQIDSSFTINSKHTRYNIDKSTSNLRRFYNRIIQINRRGRRNSVKWGFNWFLIALYRCSYYTTIC